MPAPTTTYTDKMILDAYLACGNTTDVAMSMIDFDVSHGEYEGCSTELELAYPEHLARVERVIAHLDLPTPGPPDHA